MNNKRENPQRFAPVTGEIYKNAGGGEFFCKSGGSWRSALMVNTASGWTFIAKGIVRYSDGTIEWDYSTDGEFRKPDDTMNDRIQSAQLRHRQVSLVNAMLCCMI